MWFNPKARAWINVKTTFYAAIKGEKGAFVDDVVHIADYFDI